MKKYIPFMAAGASACFFMTACGGVSGAFIVDSEDNVIKIIAENADATQCTGNITVGENDYVIFSPDLTGGSVDVKFVPDIGYDESSIPVLENANIAYEGTYSGRVLSNETIAPGDYYVFITSHKADGDMIITTSDKNEFEKQNEELQKELDKLNVELKKGHGMGS